MVQWRSLTALCSVYPKLKRAGHEPPEEEEAQGEEKGIMEVYNVTGPKRERVIEVSSFFFIAPH
jgi:hypothetical protein